MNKLSSSVAALSLALAFATPASAQGDTSPIVLLSTGGPTDTITQEVVAAAFTRDTGIKVTIRPQSDSQISAVVAQKDNPQYDLLLTGYDPYIFLLQNGALDKVNYDDIPNTKDLYQGAHATHGIGTSFTGVTLVYNTDKIKTPPTSWADLWKPEYKGHVIIPAVPTTYGLDLLVMAARTYGGNEDRIDVGFQKLKELAPNVMAVYESSSNAAQMFQLGGAWIAPWFAGRVPPTREAGVPVAAADLKEGQVVYMTMLTPLKGKYNAKVAKFMNYYLSDEAQIAFAKGIGFGPARKNVKLPPELVGKVPYGPDDVAKLVQLEWEKIIPNRAAWGQRFQTEVVPLIGRK